MPCPALDPPSVAVAVASPRKPLSLFLGSLQRPRVTCDIEDITTDTGIFQWHKKVCSSSRSEGLARCTERHNRDIPLSKIRILALDVHLSDHL